MYIFNTFHNFFSDRMYCSRRLKRIRKSLGFTQNHRNRFQKKHITVDKITDIR